MIVSDYFVYIHLSRHAGTFINQLLLEHVPSAKMLRYHGQLKDIPDAYKHLPVIGFIRNPWDWYVSMYFNYKAKNQYIFEIISESGALDFSSTLRRFINLGDSSTTSKYLLERLQQVAPKKNSQNLPPRYIRPGLTKQQFKEYPNNIGYYTWLFKEAHIVNNRLQGQFGRFENLREDLLFLLDTTNTPITREMSTYVNNMQAINTSSRNLNYEDYFSRDLQKLVYEKDNFIIDKFSYHF